MAAKRPECLRLLKNVANLEHFESHMGGGPHVPLATRMGVYKKTTVKVLTLPVQCLVDVDILRCAFKPFV